MIQPDKTCEKRKPDDGSQSHCLYTIDCDGTSCSVEVYNYQKHDCVKRKDGAAHGSGYKQIAPRNDTRSNIGKAHNCVVDHQRFIDDIAWIRPAKNSRSGYNG